MKYSFFNMVVLLLIFYVPANGQIYGKYANDRKPNIFQFNSDSTFKYEFRSFHSYLYSEGKWSIDKNGKYLILNSYIQNVQPVIDMQEYSFVSKHDSIGPKNLSFEFTTYGKFNTRDFKCEIVINDTIYDVIEDGILSSSGKSIIDSYKKMNPKNYWQNYFRCDSLSMLKLLSVNVQIKTMYFRFVFSPVQPQSDMFTNNIISTELYSPKSAFYHLTFRTNLNDSLFFYKVFSNEKVKIKKNKIAIFIENRKRWETLTKVPHSENVFINP